MLHDRQALASSREAATAVIVFPRGQASGGKLNVNMRTGFGGFKRRNEACAIVGVRQGLLAVWQEL